MHYQSPYMRHLDMNQNYHQTYITMWLLLLVFRMIWTMNSRKKSFLCFFFFLSFTSYFASYSPSSVLIRLLLLPLLRPYAFSDFLCLSSSSSSSCVYYCAPFPAYSCGISSALPPSSSYSSLCFNGFSSPFSFADFHYTHPQVTTSCAPFLLLLLLLFLLLPLILPLPFLIFLMLLLLSAFSSRSN